MHVDLMSCSRRTRRRGGAAYDRSRVVSGSESLSFEREGGQIVVVYLGGGRYDTATA